MQKKSKATISSTEMIPAWGQAAAFWESQAWKRSCSQAMQMVRSQLFPENAFTTPADPTILEWNVRGAGNKDFIEIATGVLEKHSPAIAIFTETRIRMDKAHAFLDELQLDRWEATETNGFKGGMWLAWDHSMANVTNPPLVC